MGSIVLNVILANFVIGFLVAVYLHHGLDFRRIVGSTLARAKQRIMKMRPTDETEVESPEQNAEPTEEPDPEAEAPAVEPPADQPPANWISILEEAGIVPQSVLEASMHILRLNVNPYRNQLVFLEDKLRGEGLHSASALQAVAAQVTQANRDWVKELKEASHFVAQQSGKEQAGELEREFEDILHDQAFQVESVTESIEECAPGADQLGEGKRILAELLRLIDYAHVLRDHIGDYLARLLRQEGTLTNVSRDALVDPLTKLCNRTGFSYAFTHWRKQNENKSGAVIMVDVDRFGRVNELHSTSFGDKLVSSLGIVLETLVRQDRGYDRTSRLTGARLAVFMGDTNTQDGIMAAERIRQSVEATSFIIEENQVDVTVSCAVVVLGTEDTPETVIDKAAQVFKLTRKSGRNSTGVHANGETHLPTPIPCAVNSRVVENEHIQVTEQSR